MFVRMKAPEPVNGVVVPLGRIVEVTEAEGHRLLRLAVAQEYVAITDPGRAATLRDYEVQIETRRYYRALQGFERGAFLVAADSRLELPESVGDELAARGLVERAGMPAIQPAGATAARPALRY